MNTPRQPRPGFTLVELLVVIAIVLALAGLVILFLPRVQESQRAARGGTIVQGTLFIAKQRAMRDQAPRGVRLMVDLSTGFVSSMQFIEQPDDFSGGMLSTNPAQPAPYTQIILSGVDLWNGDSGGDQTKWHVLAGDYLEIFGGGQVYRITAVTSNGMDSGITLANPVANKIDFPPGTANYRIIRGPRLTGEDVVQLPDGVAIDLNTNWQASPSGYANLNPLPVPPAGAPYVDILFAPSGRLLSPATASDFVALWIRDVSLNPGAPPPGCYYEGEPTLIGVYVRSGLVANQKLETNGVDPYAYLRDGRASGE
jgi:prepilin-type N-terminal cleavage/methylation domain-containing protein